MDKPQSDLSLIIVTHAASYCLGMLLDSIEKNSDYEHELIIVADLPSWQTVKLLQEKQLPFYTVSFRHYFMASNYGAVKATRPYLGFLNDDCYLGSHWDTALLEIMDEWAFAGLHRYEINTGESCGYSRDASKPYVEEYELHTFNPELLEEEITKNRDRPNTTTTGFPMTVHRDRFFDIYGFTFHLTHGCGHEIQFAGRLCNKYLDKFRVVESFKSGIFHWGSTNNADKIDYEKSVIAYRPGLYLCFGCGKRELQRIPEDPADPLNLAINEIGYWLCPECKEKGQGPKYDLKFFYGVV